jgi:MFS family permease
VLGVLLAMELVGMAIGSIFLGGIADGVGRRKTIIGCLIVMTIGMFMVTQTSNIYTLGFWRILTGIGIGGMLSSITAATAEFSNARRRALCVCIMSIGYPLGALFGGLWVAPRLDIDNWRFVFYFGAVVTLTFIPIVYFLIPESIHWLARKQPAGALENINRTLTRMKKATVAALPRLNDADQKGSYRDIFGPALIITTLIVSIAYFLHIMSFYYVIKWVPRIAANDFGFSPAQAGGLLNWVNFGGATGGALLGLLTLKFHAKPLTIIVLVLSTVSVFTFGRAQADLAQLATICFACGFFINAAIVGLYSLFTEAFPTHVRAFGTGFAIGLGRGGAIVSPIIAGFLFEAALPLLTVSLILGIGPLIAGGLLLFLKLKPENMEPATVAEPDPKYQAELTTST